MIKGIVNKYLLREVDVLPDQLTMIIEHRSRDDRTTYPPSDDPKSYW